MTSPAVRANEPPIPTPVFEYVINPLLEALLRSPLHGILSHSLLLITFTGRSSGSEYTTPVGYEQRNRTLYLTSRTDRVWWRNLRGGAPVTVRLRGERLDGHAIVVEDDEAVAAYVRSVIDRHGTGRLTRLGLDLVGDAVPEEDELASGLSTTVVIRVELDDDRTGDGGGRV